MRLDNESPFHAIVQVADLMKDELRGVVIIKATLDLLDDGRMVLAEEPMPLVLDRLETPFGEIHGELFFKKQGADLCVLGTVRRSSPVPEAWLRLTVGDRMSELVVYGDRYWLPRVNGPGLEPSAPRGFTELPLGYHYTFGGSAEYNGMEAALADNPVGTGYYLSAQQAEKNKLPNIEPARGRRIQQWNDHGQVMGWGPYPMYWGLRGKSSVDVDDESKMVSRIHPRLFNHAHPDLMLTELVPGQPIAIEGLGEQPLRLRVPELPALAELQLGARSVAIPAPIDGMFLWLDAKKVVVTQRARFGYEMHPKELRQVAVRSHPAYTPRAPATR